MKKKVVSLIISAAMVLGLSVSIAAGAAIIGTGSSNKVVAAADSQDTINNTKQLLNQALSYKNFYRYNMAYAAIMKLQDQGLRDQLLGQLAAISDTVWSDDVKKFYGLIDNLGKTNGSGKIYDQIQAEVGKSGLVTEDQDYLLGELASWGKRLVYTTDYANGVDKVVYAWKMLQTGTDTNINAAIADAEKAVGGIKNSYSRDYLTEEIKSLRSKTEFMVVDIN